MHCSSLDYLFGCLVFWLTGLLIGASFGLGRKSLVTVADIRNPQKWHNFLVLACPGCVQDGCKQMSLLSFIM